MDVLALEACDSSDFYERPFGSYLGTSISMILSNEDRTKDDSFALKRVWSSI